MEQKYPIVLNQLLPAGDVSIEKFPKDFRWLVTVRILPPFERPEYRFSMQETYDSKVTVAVIRAKGGSILSQLRALRSKYPNASLEKIASLISVDKLTVTQSDQPLLRKLASEFEAIEVSPVMPDELRVDDTGYQFWSRSLWGSQLNVILGGPGPGIETQPHPLLQWAEAVRSVMEKQVQVKSEKILAKQGIKRLN